MTSRRNPILLALVGALLVLAAAACASGGGGSGSAATTSGVRGAQATKTSSSEKARIAQAWTRFFAAKTSAKQKQQLLQHGSRFAAALKAQSSSPLAGRSSATVKSVKLEGPRKATVRYTIDLAGKPALKDQTGTAVKENGSWKVGDASFCSLLKLGGRAPTACASSSS